MLKHLAAGQTDNPVNYVMRDRDLATVYKTNLKPDTSLSP